MSYSEKRTSSTTRTSSSYVPDEKRSSSTVYHSNITPRTSLGSHSAKMSSYSAISPGRSYAYKSDFGFGSSGGIRETPITHSVAHNSEVEVVKASRSQEKKDMRNLNERLANYIEKVRFLEAQNRKLAGELENLRNKWGKETANIRHMYETELEQARAVLDDTSKDKSKVEIRVKSLEEQNQDLLRQLDESKQYHKIDLDQINKLNQQLAEYDGEISILRRNIETMEKERERDKVTIHKLNDEVEKLRSALNNMTLAQLDAENRRLTLSEEMEFLKSVHEEEMKELAALAYRDTTQENREFWKTELSSAINDIQNEFDIKTESIRNDLEAYYNLKVQEFKTSYTKQNMETTHAREDSKKFRQQVNDLKAKVADLETRNAQLDQQYQHHLRGFEEKDQENAIEKCSLKDEITSLRAEMEKILVELQTLLDAKLSLELEISAYRKLIEVEENRVGLKTVVENMMTSQSQHDTQYVDVIDHSSHSSHSSKSDSMAMKMMRGEVSARTTSQRTVKGPIAISDINSEGKYITLENKGTNKAVKDEVMDGWKIVRRLDGKRDVTYTFGKFTVHANKTVTIYAKGASKLAKSTDFVMENEDSWGVGTQVTTTLYNEKGEERASTVQNTIYQ